jgi:peroxiredoxin
VDFEDHVHLAVGQAITQANFDGIERYGVFKGDSAPHFAARALDGSLVDLEQLDGKVVLLDFWATWCAPCVHAMPYIQSAYEKLHERGFEVVGLSFDVEPRAVEVFAGREGLTWPMLWLEEGDRSDVADLYGVSSVPTTFLIGRDGRVLAVDPYGGNLAKLIEAALEETPAAD